MNDFTELVDLASPRLGGAVLAANDEFFAPKESLLGEGDPVFRPGEYTDRGKWMDGWETRRRRTPGHDWCVVRLGLPGVVRGVVVDTRHFVGNYPPECSLEGVSLPGRPTVEELTAEGLPWTPVLPRVPLAGDTVHRFAVEAAGPATHVRFAIYPDGGVARLRVHGEVAPDRRRLAAIASRGGEVDLAAVEHGGRVVAASDMFFGPRHNLLLPGPPRGMHDGWETRRRRGPGHDWAVVRLGVPGAPRRLEVDTSHFKGNAPGSCSLDGTAAESPPAGEEGWREILPRTPLLPHTRHLFEEELAAGGSVRFVRLNIYPDGGVGRLRVFGTPEMRGLDGGELEGGAAADEAPERRVPDGG